MFLVRSGMGFVVKVALVSGQKGRGELGDVGLDDDIKIDIEGKRCDVCVVIWLQNGHPRVRRLITDDGKKYFVLQRIENLC